MADFWVKRGDLKPSIEATLEDAEGNPVDINGAEVQFAMRAIRHATAEPFVLADASNDQNGDGSDGSLGKVHYDWIEGDTDEPNGYYAEWQVSFADEKTGTFPNQRNIRVAVLDDLDWPGS